MIVCVLSLQSSHKIPQYFESFFLLRFSFPSFLFFYAFCLILSLCHKLETANHCSVDRFISFNSSKPETDVTSGRKSAEHDSVRSVSLLRIHTFSLFLIFKVCFQFLSLFTPFVCFIFCLFADFRFSFIFHDLNHNLVISLQYISVSVFFLATIFFIRCFLHSSTSSVQFCPSVTTLNMWMFQCSYIWTVRPFSLWHDFESEKNSKPIQFCSFFRSRCLDCSLTFSPLFNFIDKTKQIFYNVLTKKVSVLFVFLIWFSVIFLLISCSRYFTCFRCSDFFW